MTKKEVKFSLLGDYINILHISKVCDFCSFDCFKTLDVDEKLLSIKTMSSELKNMYENLFFKLGLMDLSLLILKKEILGVGHQGEIMSDKVSAKTIEAFYSILKKITKNINYKLKKLRFSEIEVNYLIKNIVIKCIIFYVGVKLNVNKEFI